MAPKGFRLKQNYDAQPIDILKGKIPLDTSPGKFQVLLSTEHEIDRVPLSNKTRVFNTRNKFFKQRRTRILTFMVKCALFTFYVKLKYAEGPTDGTYSSHIFVRVEFRFGIYNKSFEVAKKRQLNVTTSAL